MKTPPVITNKGKETLGKFLKESREGMSLSLDAFLAKVKESTGQEISKSTLSELERGNSVPKWDTLSILAWGKFYVNPITKNYYTASELFEIACEYFDPFTGDRKDGSDDVTVTDQKADQNGSERIRNPKSGSVRITYRNGSERLFTDQKRTPKVAETHVKYASL